MIASLQMYDWPQLHDAYDTYWALIRDGLKDQLPDVPEELTRFSEESEAWLMPDLLLSQTCSMPYRQELHDKVTLVGTPDYGLTDCPPGFFRSAIVVRADDPRTHIDEFRNAMFAFNGKCSQSGYVAAYFHLRDFDFWFKNTTKSYGHRRSAQMLVSEKADIASLDAVSWHYLQTYDAFASELRVLDWTEPTPALPYITGASVDRTHVFDAVAAAIDKLPDATRDQLCLRGLVYIPPDDYLNLPSI
jgi:ABC-type phosphate/phosphonate transport system substrate-binding protein